MKTSPLKNWKGWLVRILLSALVLALAAGCLQTLQTQSDYARQTTESEVRLSQIAEQYAQNKAEAKRYMQTFNANSQAKADAIALYMLYDPALANNDYVDLATLATAYNVEEIVIIDGEGNINASSHYGREPNFCGEFVYSKLCAGVSGIDYVWPDGQRIRYFAARRQDAVGYVVIGRPSSDFLATALDTASLDKLLRNARLSKDGYVFAVSKETGKIVYHPNPQYEGQPASVLGMDAGKLNAGYRTNVNMDGKSFYCISQDGDLVTLFTASANEKEMQESRSQVFRFTLLVLCAAAVVLLAYGVIVRSDYHSRAQNMDIGKLGFLRCNRTVLKKVLPITVMALCVLLAASFYIQSLFTLSREAMIMNNRYDDIENTLQRNTAAAEQLTEVYDRSLTAQANAVALMINNAPSLLEGDALRGLAQAMRVRDIYVFDGEGRTVATNTSYKDFVLSSDPEEQSYAFREVLRGYVDVLVQEPKVDDYGENTQFVGVKRLDAPGIVQIGVEPEMLSQKLASTSVAYTLQQTHIGVSGFAFAMDKTEAHTLEFFPPNSKLRDKTAVECGIDPAVVRDGYEGMQRIGGTDYYMRVYEAENDYVALAIERGELYANRLSIALWTMLWGGLALLFIALLCAFSLKEENATEGAAETSEKADTPLTKLLARRSEKTPEQRLTTVVGAVILVAMLLVILDMTYYSQGNANSVMTYIAKGQWDKGFNIFAVTSALLTCFAICVAAVVAGRVIEALTASLGTRSGTIGRLISSIVKYAGIIAAVFTSLTYFGVNPTTLVASAGLLTMVIGLGAQKIIGDILAGCFVVSEGAFQVGDIVTVGTWRGTVVDIGLRTTKIKDGSNNIKIFNNSEITNIINMTREQSVVVCDVGVDYGESLERVESVLSRELPEVKKRLTAITDGPYYRGVAALADSSVNIRIIAKCSEADRIQLERDLNRELKLIFDRNDINIPFPQVVLNYPAAHAEASPQEKRRGDRFAKEQAELTKGMEEETEA